MGVGVGVGVEEGGCVHIMMVYVCHYHLDGAACSEQREVWGAREECLTHDASFSEVGPLDFSYMFEVWYFAWVSDVNAF